MEPVKILYGSQNFGYDTPNSDTDWMYIHIPTYKDILLNKEIAGDTIEKDFIVKNKDIRSFRKLLIKSNFQDLQILFSKVTFNIDIIKWFIDNRYDLLYINLNKMYESNKGFVIQELNNYEQTKEIKHYLRALSTLGLLKKIKDKNIQDFCDPSLRQIRFDNKPTLSIDAIKEEINELEPYFVSDLNEKLIDEVDHQIILILKKYLSK